VLANRAGGGRARWQAGAQEQRDGSARRCGLRRHLLLQRCVSHHRFGAALVRLCRRLDRVAAFQLKSSHGNGKQQDAVVDSLLGDELPSSAATVARALRASSVWLSCGWFRLLRSSSRSAAATCSARSPFSSARCDGHLRRRLCGARLRRQQAVETYGWLKPGEMLDGLGMAETTPGPLIMVLQFVGFMAAFRDAGGLSPMLAGTLGGLLATWVTFTPCFLWIFLGAPFVEVLRGNRR